MRKLLIIMNMMKLMIIMTVMNMMMMMRMMKMMMMKITIPKLLQPWWWQHTPPRCFHLSPWWSWSSLFAYETLQSLSSFSSQDMHLTSASSSWSWLQYSSWLSSYMLSTWPSPHLPSLAKGSSGSNQAQPLLHFHDECAYTGCFLWLVPPKKF